MAKRTSRRTGTGKRGTRDAPLFDAAGDGVDVLARRGGGDTVVGLHEAAQARYLNYALSVITSRALPDVRDGLKPVQRRILYTMWQQRLRADAKPRKCAKVVGDVMGSYHPHGDAAIYDTLVRMAQPFTLRAPLVDGSGNFGSLDGDGAAAMRYTECRLAAISAELLREIDEETVAFQPNYDGTRQEPVVLPARVPNLLVNGATGIAVGMATNIPPHNLGEVATALVNLLDDPDLTSTRLARDVRGPDFPTGGQLVNTTEELTQIYTTGSGTVRVRATWEPGERRRSSNTVHVTSVPYGVNKAQLVERIAEVVVGRKLPPLLDVKDVSTDDVRIELELKADADERMVMAYLFKHTPLQTTFPVNLTCLVPTGQPGVGRPERLALREMLWHFLLFRLDVVTRRLEHERAALGKRIHILEGFEKVFDALDAIIAMIRQSDGKADAAAKIMEIFGLDAEQTDAILELKIYRLARLEILIIRKELEEKRARARQIDTELGDEERRWRIVRDEIVEIREAYGEPRRTAIDGPADDEMVFSADDFIVDEDAVALVSRDGWVKRQREVRDPAATRLREGDALLAAVAGSTRATVAFFTNFGVAYSCRHDRLRRAGPAAVQAEGRRARGDRAQPRCARRGRHRGNAVAAGAAHPCGGGVERRLQPAIRPAGVQRAEHTHRPPVRAAGEGRRDRRRGRDPGRRDAHRRDPRGARHAVPGAGDQLPVRPREGRAAHQAGEGPRPRDRLHRLARRSRSADGGDQPRRRAHHQHREVRARRPRRQGAGAAAARAVHARRSEADRNARDRRALSRDHRETRRTSTRWASINSSTG